MKAFWGGLMIAAGLLIAGASGLCSGALLWSALTSSGPVEWPMLLMVLVIGGTPFAGGLALIFGGWAIIREGGKDKPDW